MNQTKRFGALSSSSDPSKLSTTVSGGMIAISVLIIWGAKYLGLEVTSDQISSLAIQLGGAVSTVMVIFGIVRKVIVAVQQKFTSQG